MIPAAVARHLQRGRRAVAHLIAGRELHQLRVDTQRELAQKVQDLLERTDAVLSTYDRRVAAVVNRLLDLEQAVEAGSTDLEPGDDANRILAGHDTGGRHRVLVAFEDERDPGRLDLDAERLAAELDLLREHPPVVELGFGGPLLLELLSGAGVAACGVYANPFVAEKLQGSGLDARPGDLASDLADRPDASVGALRLIHVVDHLDLATLDGVLRDAYRVLRPGGLALIGSTYPECERSMADFWRDPTRVRPYHPSAIRLLAENAGFDVLEVRRFPPADEDYGVVARRR